MIHLLGGKLAQNLEQSHLVFAFFEASGDDEQLGFERPTGAVRGARVPCRNGKSAAK